MLRTRVAIATLVAMLASVEAAGAAPSSAPGAAGDDAPAVARSEYGSYVVVMQGEPLSVTADLAAQGSAGLDDPEAQVAADRLLDRHDDVLTASGIGVDAKIHDYTVALNGFSALLTHEEAEQLAARDDVAHVFPDELRQTTTDASPAFLGLTGTDGAWAQGYTGEGVVVGVIDSGIWPEHPSFADDGSYPDPPVRGVPCEFGAVGSNVLDAPFRCNDKLVGARQVLDTYREVVGIDDDEFDSARDDNGHGTHVASTAAGNRGVQARIVDRPVGAGPIAGIAHRAHVIAYKALGNNGGLTSDLVAAIDLAVADGVDVINYSIGGGGGTIGPDDIAFLFAAAAGVHVATSAGNSGPGPVTIGAPGHVPWLTTVGANTQRRQFTGLVQLGNGELHEGVSLMPATDRPLPLVDAAEAGSDRCVPGELDPQAVAGKIVLCLRGQIARVEKSLAVEQAGGAGMILFNSDDAESLNSDTHWVPAVHVDNATGLKIAAYIAEVAEPTATLDSRLGVWPAAPSMASFSSRGENPLADDVIKPDITAPGLQILAGWSPFPDAIEVPGQLFAAIGGTSMSSPHVAGVMALLEQAEPNWSPAALKSAMMTTADPEVLDENLADPASPFAMGSGQVDPGPPAAAGSAFQPGLVYEAGYLDYLAFLCGNAPEVFSDSELRCGQLQGAGYLTDSSDLNYPSIGVGALAGTQTVTRTVTQTAPGTQRWLADVEEPEGYDIRVSPAEVTLAHGERATFEVTITNRGTAPIEEFAFGSLTWRSGASTVRSPIAIRASLLAAPDEITGTGASGTAFLALQFGYTGSYTAGAHGLVPATVTSDTVRQDPDQSFDPDDDAGTNAHTLDLDDVALLRIALPPDATEDEADLDVFVVDPDGDLVAQSTQGGTDELIDVLLPQDGTWTVYVHGWSAPGGSSPYDLFTWQVPLATGGSLEIASAPDAAVSGETGTVEVAWDGLEDEWYLGAVSHTGPAELLGLTPVEVDNRDG